MRHEFMTAIQHRNDATVIPGAGGDQLNVRIDAEHGECPVAVVEGVSEDRDWVPFHSHPWDELTYVLDGTIEFRVGDTQATGTVGTVVSLPRGVPHSLRVPEGTARYLMVTFGAPAIGFLREVGELYAAGPTMDRLLELAARYGVKPVADGSSSQLA